MSISLETLSTSATSTIFFFSKIFIATFSPVLTCTPSFTFPKVPCPMTLPTRYWPTWRDDDLPTARCWLDLGAGAFEDDRPEPDDRGALPLDVDVDGFDTLVVVV